MKNIKVWLKLFVRGSHHRLNGFNLIIILVMLFVMAYHISLSNQNVPRIVSSSKKVSPIAPVLSKNNDFFRYPASEKQKMVKKSRQIGYANYTLTDITGTDNVVVAVFPKDAIQANLKYRWILKEDITHVSGDLEGQIDLSHQESIEIIVKRPSLESKYFLGLELYRDEGIKRGYVQVISFKDGTHASQENNTHHKAMIEKQAEVDANGIPKKKLRVLQ